MSGINKLYPSWNGQNYQNLLLNLTDCWKERRVSRIIWLILEAEANKANIRHSVIWNVWIYSQIRMILRTLFFGKLVDRRDQLHCYYSPNRSAIKKVGACHLLNWLWCVASRGRSGTERNYFPVLNSKSIRLLWAELEKRFDFWLFKVRAHRPRAGRCYEGAFEGNLPA